MASFVCAVISAVAVAIPATNHSRVAAKLAMFYLGVGIEMFSTWLPPLLWEQSIFPEEDICERYAALSLIIMLV